MLSLDNINPKSADLKAVHIFLRIRNESIVYFLYADVRSQHVLQNDSTQSFIRDLMEPVLLQGFV